MDIYAEMKKARLAGIGLANTSIDERNLALEYIIEELEKRKEEIILANEKDLKLGEEENLAKPLLKRLVFDKYKIDGVIEGIRTLISLEDPIDNTSLSRELDEGLDLYRVSCPIGVLAVIFESRPDAFVQIATLALKSGNACVLKGGSEAKNTNAALYELICEASLRANIDVNWIKNLSTREEVGDVLKADEYIDLIIPRGSNDFVQYIMKNTNIPVLGHADGICHVYLDEEIDEDMAINIVLDSKTQYVTVCNALETLLINKNVSVEFIERLYEELSKKNVVVNGDEEVLKITGCETLTEEKLRTEFLDYELNIKLVEDLDEAIGHINKYGSHHTDAIVTKNGANALKFMDYVDSANVFYNCSTRFSDGFRYGFGAEVGISTNKIHARGPVGLDGLTIYKYKLVGHGQVVEPYARGEKSFTHKDINRTFE